MANGRKTDQQRITATERRIKVLAYRKAGATYRAIADTLAVSLATVHDDMQRAYAELNEQQQAEAAEAQALEAARLDDLQRACWQQAMSGNLKAIETARRISESRRKLFGLDAPTLIAPVNADGTPYETQQQLVGVVLNLLAPYPDLRLALAAQLTEESDDVQDTIGDGA